MAPADVSWVSAMPVSWAGASALSPSLRLVPLAAVLGGRGAGARFSRTPLSGTLAPRALPFADIPDVTCCLLMATHAALALIMGYGRRVQTGVPMSHLYP